MFLKFGARWISIAAITHIDFHEDAKKATLYVGSVPVLEASEETYAFFRGKDTGFFFTQPVG
jgi:hypothetical protein